MLRPPQGLLILWEYKTPAANCKYSLFPNAVKQTSHFRFLLLIPMLSTKCWVMVIFLYMDFHSFLMNVFFTIPIKSGKTLSVGKPRSFIRDTLNSKPSKNLPDFTFYFHFQSLISRMSIPFLRI
jgi:hypothetical protein